MQTQTETLPEDVATLQQMVVALREKEEHWKRQYEALLEQWRLAQMKRFGRSSEQDDGQGRLFDETEQQLHAQAQDDDEEDEEEREQVTYTRRKSRGRAKLPAELPRTQVIHDLDEADKQCTCCGGTLHRMGEETHEQLEFVPARIQVIENIRPKYACRHCDRRATESRIRIAPPPPQPIPKSIATPSLLAQIITAKYQYGLPLYRQQEIFRSAGIELARQTMSQWVVRCAEVLERICERLYEHLLAQECIWGDDTTLNVLDQSQRHHCYMWVYGSGGDQPAPGGPPNIVLYDYQRSHEARHPVNFLRGYRGYLQADGYPGYEHTEATVVGCMAHARRKFHEARQAQPKRKRKTSAAEWVLRQMRKLYRIEEALKGQSPEPIHRRRQAEARPLLDELKAWLDDRVSRVPRESALGKAVHYTLGQWPKLVRYIDDGRLAIDNNRAERAIKPFVNGRKAWLFSNTENGARASATLYSIVETARANALVPFDYLMHLLTELPKLERDHSIDHLLPWNVTLSEPQGP